MDINKLMQQAQAMQKKLEETNEKINAMEFEGEASNGLVKVVVSGEYKVLSLNVDPSILNPDDKEMIEDLIVIALNNAIEKVEGAKNDSFGSMASALGIPTK